MPVLIAKIALSAATFAIDKPYDYLIPAELAELSPGVRVIVPFGAGNRRTEGIVLAVETAENLDKRLKSILACLDEEPVLTDEGIRTALWMRERWFCTVYDAVRAMLPAGLYYALQDCYRLADGIEKEAALEAAGRSKYERQVVELVSVRQSGLEAAQIREAFGTKDPGPALRSLLGKGVLALETSAARGVGDKTEKLISLAIPPEEALAQVTPKRKTAPLRYAVVELLAGIGEAAVKEVCYFTGAANATIRSLEKSGLVTITEQEVFRRAGPDHVEPAGPVKLNREQDAAFQGLNAMAEAGTAAVALLYGVTGSGKTQVYLRLIEETLKRGKTALTLVPEIALTPQLMAIYTAHFGDEVAVLHSSLRAGERYDEWKRIRTGKAQVVIGTRSAVFAPLERLGLVILDEEQEGSYKSENVPRYHARDVAKYRAQRNGALLVLGSATPSVETMYHARQGDYRLFTLARRYNERELPAVFLADMKEELQAGNTSPLSLPLRQALEENLKRGEQSILFLNRRGASRMVTCVHCGQVPSCPRCSAYLTYHSANHRLMCHYCGHSEPMPDSCPDCGGALEFVGAGTQRVEETLKELFPDVEVMRMDADTVTASQSHEKLLARFREERIPILVGTQMVAKGLDFENVTLVGVISADQGLYLDDYRAGERTFSLITQVVGRAGRGSKAGRAIIQTFTPENDVITAAARQDYDHFYEQEIGLRKVRNCPPFSSFFVITVSGAEEGQTLRVCAMLRDTLLGWLGAEPYRGFSCQVLGPAPAAITKVNNRYRYRLTLMAENIRLFRALVAHLVRCAQADRKNRGVSITADIDPMN
ncbi:primosomal protein N' [Pseudoflavonifractor phocaeensis]|uniref:replication restart helicase PriA n=1 Tax=Pseudoflavonifractor phocaeensis TaxID=1870988 RepID=UPI00313C711E